MGNATQTVFTGVGAVVGFVMGGPLGAAQGASIGYQIGSAIDPDVQHREGPRLTDKRVQGGAYGQPITELYGDGYVRPFLAWAIPLTEVATTTREGGKGGPPPTETTTYTAYLTCAFVLANNQAKLKRIKADGKVIWDASTASTGPITTSGSASIRKALGMIAASTPEFSFEFYDGASDQAPSAIMQEHLGTTWTPAYRGRCLIVLKNFSLGPYGSRIPLFEFELVENGSSADQTVVNSAMMSYEPDTGESLFGANPWSAWYVPKTDRIVTVLFSNAFSAGSNPNDGPEFEIWNPTTKSREFSVGHSWYHGYGPGQVLYDEETNCFWYRHAAELRIATAVNGWHISSDPKLSFLNEGISTTPFNVFGLALINSTGEVWCTFRGQIRVYDKAKILAGKTLAESFKKSIATPWGPNDDSALYLISGGDGGVISRRYNIAELMVYDKYGNVIVSSTMHGGAGESTTALYVDSGQNIAWFFNTTTNYLSYYDVASNTTSQVRLLSGGDLFTFDIDEVLGAAIICNGTTKAIEWVSKSNETLLSVDITTHFNVRGIPVAIRWIPSYSVLVLIWATGGSPWMVWISVGRVPDGSAAVSKIVSDKCLAAGVDPGKVDVTQITEIITGIQYEGLMQARDQIAALKSIGQFDLGMSNGKVTAKKRGSASVKTVSYLDLIASPDGSGTLEVVHSDNQDVPGSVEVGFQDPAADFEVSYQSVVRPTAVNGEIKRFQVPASISAAQAKRIAESEMYLAEFRRRGYTLPTTAKHIDIEQYDPFDFLWADGRVTRMVAQRVEYSFPLKVSIVAIEDNSSLHTLTSTGVPSGATKVYPSAAGGVSLYLLDIPLLKDSDNFAGFYVRVSASSDAFSSGSLYESIDGGVTYNSLGAVSIGPAGYALGALGTFSGGAVWDYINTVDVVVGVSDTVESYTEAQVYAGLGGWLLGSEIIQAKDATLIAARTYRLSNLLRGRKGTEWAVGSHVIGERAIPLDGSVKRFSSSAYNVPRLYKVAAPGQALEDVSAQYFSNQQIGMKPLSPDNITATRDGSGNITLLWWRRSRVGTAWGPAYDMPLDEDIEKFEIDIMSGATVKRTIIALGPFSVQPTAPYPAADQTTDFGSLRTEGTLLVNIYQISSLVGRGYVGSKTV